MLKNQKKQLKKLQQEKNNLISEIKKIRTEEIQEKNDKRISEIKKEIANLNKLDDNEKNIHAIWIGIPKKGEFDNIKIWAKYNPEYKIHIWTDSTHILSHKLNNIIFENSKIINNGLIEHDYQLEADLKNYFYNNYQLKNSKKTFDENAKQFLLDQIYANQNQIINWIKEGKKTFIEEQKEIKEYTSNEVIIHDVNQEKDSIFPSKQYYEGYLKTLEHLHLCAGSSDRLRYAILDKFGGAYLDTDLSMQFDISLIKKSKKMTELIYSVKWKKFHNSFNKLKQKPEIIMNHIILLENLNQLNNENLKNFTKKWEEIFGGDVNSNLKILKKIAKKYKKLKCNSKPKMQLDQFPIDNSWQTIAYEKDKNNVYNCFILSKKNSNFLQQVMKKIEAIDENLENINMDTYTKLINKNEMILYHTGPFNLYYTILENDENHFYQNEEKCCNLVSLATIDSYCSSWFNENKPKNSINNHKELQSLFLGKIKKTKSIDYKYQNKIKTDSNNQSQNINSNLKLSEDEFYFEKE